MISLAFRVSAKGWPTTAKLKWLNTNSLASTPFCLLSRCQWACKSMTFPLDTATPSYYSKWVVGRHRQSIIGFIVRVTCLWWIPLDFGRGQHYRRALFSIFFYLSFVRLVLLRLSCFCFYFRTRYVRVSVSVWQAMDEWVNEWDERCYFILVMSFLLFVVATVGFYCRFGVP